MPDMIAVLPLDEVLEEVTSHAHVDHYPISETVQLLLVHLAVLRGLFFFAVDLNLLLLDR